MAKEDKIVEAINVAIKADLKHERFSGSQLVGITQLLPRGEQRSVPCTVDHDGECTEIDIDDTKPLQIYHRNNGTLSMGMDQEQTFGNNTTWKQVSSMSLFAIAQRKMIRMTVEDLFLLIQNAIPKSIAAKPLTLKSCFILFQSSDVNALAILKREQPNKTLDPQVIMFELKYLIECSYSKDCINTICCN